LDEKQISAINVIITRRKKHEPLPYILGSVSFFDCTIHVSKDVLIPRQETEILVETVLKNESDSNKTFIDMGTGSGGIASALSSKRIFWKSVCVDISFRALTIAKKNALQQSLFLCSDMFLSLKQNKCTFDFIVSNPPYITATEMLELDKSVSEYEPTIALFGGTDGLDFYRILASQGSMLLKKGCSIYCEIGYMQAASVMDIFDSHGWKNICIIKDLGNRDRVCKAIRG
jgi:release factor glutamine methyltransferase